MQGPKITFEGGEFINFASNDYLGLAGRPEILAAAKTAIDAFGFGGGASRLLGGGSVLHHNLEQRVAEFKSAEAALIFNSGFAANTGIIPCLASEGDALFSDELNHASIIDGCRLSKAKTVIYRHCDVGHLRELVEREKAKRRIVVTDTVFSMDGDIAPLKELYALCLSLTSGPHGRGSLLLYLDDAHGTGVLGSGRGALAHVSLSPKPWIVQMGTFSKALGSCGAFVAGSKEAVEWITNTARSFIFSTAAPACIAAASLKALELVEQEPELNCKLWHNRHMLADALREMDFDTGGSETPVIPLKMDSVGAALDLSAYLFDKGIYAPAIRPPTVKEPRVRIAVTAAHSDEDIASLIDALSDRMKQSARITSR